MRSPVSCYPIRSPNRGAKRAITSAANGFGLIEVLVGIAVVSIVIGTSLRLLNASFANQAAERQAALVKKSFSGAEMVLIDQRQCRCNFGFTPSRDISFRADTFGNPNQSVSLKQIRTYENTDSCTNPSGEEDILADTTGTAPAMEADADYITLINIESVVPELLYRGLIVIKPKGGSPARFPILMETRPDGGNPAFVDVEICGVDRAS